MYKSLRYIFWFISIFFFSFFIYQLSKYNFDLIYFFEKKYQYIAYIFGAIGGLFAIENFHRKEGLSILGNLSTTHFFGKPEDSFDTSFIDLTLINRKDKPIIIFDVYVKIGSNTYIHLKQATKEHPIIIKGYEYYYEEFNEAYFYSSGINAYSLRSSKLTNKYQIHLHTSEGIYKVKKLKPHNEFYRFYSRLLKPERLEFNETTVPLNTAYILNFYDLKDKLHSIYIKKEYTWIQIENFKIESAEKLDREKLEQELNIGIESRALAIKSFQIIDFQEKLNQKREKFLHFKNDYNPLNINTSFDKGSKKHMTYVYYKNKFQKIISSFKKIKK